MKIAFVDVTVTVNYGGIQTAVWELARVLTQLGHEVSVFGGEGAVLPVLDASIVVRRFPYTPRERFPKFGTRFRKLAERISFARQARAAVADGGFDWVILTKPFDFVWPRMMPKGGKTRFAFMSGGTDFFKGDRWLAQKVDAWFACSHFNAWQLYQHYRQFPRVMFNGVDVDRFAPGVRDEALREQWGVRQDEVVFAFAGRLVGWKGLHLAIAALASDALKDLPVRLLIIGKGEAQPKLEAQAAALGVTRQVLFPGAVAHADLPKWYASSDAGIFPSVGDEAFGITIAEAMSCGLPVVASYNGGIPEVVGNEEHTGYLFESGNVAECAAAMRRLVVDASQRQGMGQAARLRIQQRYTWEASARRLLKGLEGACASPT